jgi:hypothetical protein
MWYVFIMFMILFLLIILRDVLIEHYERFLNAQPYLLQPNGNCLDYARSAGLITPDYDDPRSIDRMNVLSDMELMGQQGTFANDRFFYADPVCVLPKEAFHIYSTRDGKNGINQKKCELVGKTAYDEPVSIKMVRSSTPRGCGLSMTTGGKELFDTLDTMYQIKHHDYIKQKLNTEAILKEREAKRRKDLELTQQHLGPKCRMVWVSDAGKEKSDGYNRFVNLPLSCENGEVLTRILAPDYDGIGYECCRVDDTGLIKENKTMHSTGWFDSLKWNDVGLTRYRLNCGENGGIQQIYMETKEMEKPLDPQAKISYTCAHFDKVATDTICETTPREVPAWHEMKCNTTDGGQGFINSIKPVSKSISNVNFEYTCCAPKKFRRVK